MKRVMKIISLLVMIVMLFAFAEFKPMGTSPVVLAEGKMPEDIGERLSDSIVLYVGSPSAFVNNASVQVDPSNPMVKPIIQDSRTLVPVRFIAESLGAEVGWDGKTSRITVALDGKTVQMTLGSKVMKVGNTEVTLDVAADAVGGRTLIPLRALTEALGREVFYDRGLIVISHSADIFNPETEKQQIDNLIAQLNQLPVLASYEQLEELLGKLDTSRENRGIALSGGMMEDAVKSESAKTNSVQSADIAAVSTADSNKADYSETNVQVQGVDEADVVKTDGEYIYQVNRQRVVIAKAYPAEEMQVVSTVGFTDARFNPMEIYLHGDQMVVIGNSYVEMPLPAPDSNETSDAKRKSGYYPPYYSKGTVKAIVYDISDKSNIKSIREVELEGYYVSSRKIGSALYMVANRQMNYYMLKDNQGMVLPAYRDSAVSDDFAEIGYNSVQYFPDMAESNYMIVAGINLDENEQAATIQTYLGSGNTIYVSGQNLYVVSAGYRSAATKSAAGGIVSIMPQIMPVYDYNTIIYKFSLHEGKITYLTKGEVPGTVLNQFSMDENGGYFRIATTSNHVKVNDQFTSTNDLYVLDDMLNITGRIEEIAPGEKIYSVRFMGDRAYMVTFKTVDPLFVIDLKDPKNPSILGALKIPGYSNYLHPYDENHIIGFGKDTVEMVQKDGYGREVGRNAYYLGMKIAIFDVTDVNNPIEMYTEKIGDRGTESPLLNNHKALLFDRARNLLAFPVSVAEIKGSKADTNGFPQYGQQVFQGAYVYSVDLEKGFQLKGKITHLSPEESLKSGYDKYYGDKSVERILRIDDHLYTLSQGMIKANTLSELEEVGKVVIP